MSKEDHFDFSQSLPMINEDTEFFPLMSQQDEDEMNNEETPEILLSPLYASLISLIDLSLPTVMGITTPGKRTVFLSGSMASISGVSSLFISSSSC